ncbi:hypothetical protein LH457_06730 [Laribacter hongkongensis]|nr:hypothetical protein [Laribacter hongkongensis]
MWLADRRATKRVMPGTSAGAGSITDAVMEMSSVLDGFLPVQPAVPLTGGVILPPHRLILLSGPYRGRYVSA